MAEKELLVNRWRLALGKYADDGLGQPSGRTPEGASYVEIDELLDFLYEREYGEERGICGCAL
jgi:hypothetical protein